MAILPIRLYPDPVLRLRCAEVEQFDEQLAGFVADMVETMHAAPGVGLAASQVGVTRRVAVVDLSVGKNPDDLLVLVNPEIVSGDGEEVDTEGCLSLPDFTEKVARSFSIQVRARSMTGELFELEADDWLARAIQHEVDHLDGVLFVDRLRGLRKERARRALKKMAERAAERGEESA
jgi:peptide deformylase